MGVARSYSALIEELGLAKSLDTAEDDGRIAAAAGEDAGQYEPDGGGELHPADAAVLKVLRKITDVVSGLSGEVRDLRAEVGALKGRDGKPMAKALRLPSGSPMTGEEFMAKAMSAQAAGRITGIQVATAEAHINASKAPPRDIIAAVID